MTILQNKVQDFFSVLGNERVKTGFCQGCPLRELSLKLVRLESGKSTGVLKKFWKTVAENECEHCVFVDRFDSVVTLIILLF